MSNPWPLLAWLACVAAGLYCVVGGLSGAAWFMRGRNMAAAVAGLGRRAGARAFYVVLGLAAIALSTWIAWLSW